MGPPTGQELFSWSLPRLHTGLLPFLHEILSSANLCLFSSFPAARAHAHDQREMKRARPVRFLFAQGHRACEIIQKKASIVLCVFPNVFPRGLLTDVCNHETLNALNRTYLNFETFTSVKYNERYAISSLSETGPIYQN